MLPRTALAFATALSALLTLGALRAQAPANVWAVVYTPEQAARGKAVYDKRDCITCHAEDGSPGDDGIPPIKGPYFMSRWDGNTVGDITTFITANMPRTKPGTLSPQEVADVTAYLLKLNELPAGATALPADAAAVKAIRFTEVAPAR